MYNKAKRYSIPAYKEAKGMRGELIRKVVNYLHRLNDDTTIHTFRHNAHFAILTAHDENVLAHTGDVEVAGLAQSLEYCHINRFFSMTKYYRTFFLIYRSFLKV